MNKILYNKRSVLCCENADNDLCCRGLIKRMLKASALSLALSFCFFAAPALADTVPVPTLGENSAYTLEKVNQAGENVITKYEWSDSENKYVPVYYRVDLSKTEYGNPNGDTTLTFGWEKNADGNLEFKQDPTSPVGQTITYKYSESDFSKTETHTLDKGVVDITGGTMEAPLVIEGGAALKNDIGAEISVDKVLFINNKTNVTANLTDVDRWTSSHADVAGGALYNAGKIDDITGVFINNSITADANDRYLYASGGGIANYGDINTINADFILNSISILYDGNSYARGGAIYNQNKISDIIGNFLGNKVSAPGWYAEANGGAIYNNSFAEIVNIKGDFIGNYSIGDTSNGGAIYNEGKIENIESNFVENYVNATEHNAFGGAIFNIGYIGHITGDFIGNYTDSNGMHSFTQGGALYNARGGKIEGITGDFIGNYSMQGGAILNEATLGQIKGNFIQNHSQDLGGAIMNDGRPKVEMLGIMAFDDSEYNYTANIGSITGAFIGNYIKDEQAYSSLGGAIANLQGGIDFINADFFGNYVSSARYSYGGAISNEEGKLGNITGNFVENYALSSGLAGTGEAYGGALSNVRQNDWSFSEIGNIAANFIGNYTQASGDNSVAQGGAFYNYNATVENVTGNFIGNYAQSTGRNSVAQGGAIYNYSYDEELITIGSIVNSSFINNFAKSEIGPAQGGAIYTNKDLNIVAKDGGQTVFSGNYTESNGVKISNAIYMDGLDSKEYKINSYSGNKAILTEVIVGTNPVLTLNANNKGIILFDDQIEGNPSGVTQKQGVVSVSEDAKERYGVTTVDEYIEYAKNEGWFDADDTNEEIIENALSWEELELKDEQIISSETKGSYDLKITGDSTGKVILNNDVINANISLDNTNLYLGRDDVFNQSQSLTLNSGSMSMINNQAGTMNIQTFNLNGTTNLGVDVDLANKQMDTIKATNYNVTEGAKLNVNNINLLNDAKQDKTDILFTDNKDLASATAYTGASPIAYSPIYKYEVAYNPDNGFFTFNRGGSGNQSDNFNPAVLAPSVATQAGAYTTQLQTFNYAFQHADTFMNIPYMERTAMKHSGRYALSPTGDATDVGTFSPLLTKEQDAGFWVKPYASFENIPLNNGPKVSNINYGTLVGYDSSLTPIAKGWERVLTGYVGYNGASQRYSGVDAYQNGGILGGTATLYKGNFFNATTLSVGATAGDASTMYGNENYAML